MKKIIFVLTLLLVLSGCSNKMVVNYTYDIKSKDVDMSSYEEVNSTNHMFKGITIQELFNCIDNKSSGIFYFGRTNCACCQICAKYINKAAEDLNLTVFYIDVYDKDMPIDSELQNKLKEYLKPILEKDDEGVPMLQTPIVFSVINGELFDSIIGLGTLEWDNVPTKPQENKLINRYKEIFKPFVK